MSGGILIGPTGGRLVNANGSRLVLGTGACSCCGPANQGCDTVRTLSVTIAGAVTCLGDYCFQVPPSENPRFKTLSADTINGTWEFTRASPLAGFVSSLRFSVQTLIYSVPRVERTDFALNARCVGFGGVSYFLLDILHDTLPSPLPPNPFVDARNLGPCTVGRIDQFLNCVDYAVYAGNVTATFEVVDTF